MAFPSMSRDSDTTSARDEAAPSAHCGESLADRHEARTT
jgi:hypothetical protein